MFCPGDVPAFREQIFANAALLFHEGDGGLSLTKSNRKFEIVCYTREDSEVYEASLIDLSTTEVVLKGDTDPNFAVAVHNLFEETANRIAKIMDERDPELQKKKQEQREKDATIGT